MKLNEISDNQGARKPRIRVGRGIGSGKGKTCGRGVKGQKSRTGVSINGFEGGQMPIFRRLPKRGFHNLSRREFAVINIGDIQGYIDAGSLKADEKITSALLIERGFARGNKAGIKLLAKGGLTAKINLSVDAASPKAIELVKALGGSVEVPAPVPAPAKKEKKASK